MPSVWLIDDSAMVRRLLRHHLERMGVTVREFADSVNALDCLCSEDGKAEPPLLMLIDLDMPEMDGPSLIDAAHKAGAACPMVLCSGMDSKSLHDVGVRCKATATLTKPVEPAVLAHLISTLTRRSLAS